MLAHCILRHLRLSLAGLCAITAPAFAADSSAVEAYFRDAWGLSLSNVSWGDVHAHSYYSGDTVLQPLQPENPATLTPADVLATMKERGLSFGSVTDHGEAAIPEHIVDGSANVWQSALTMTRAANDEDASDGSLFIGFPGFEYTNPFPCWDLSGVGDDGYRQCPGDCGRGDETCEAHGHKNVIFRSIDDAPRTRASFLDPQSWTAPPSECAGGESTNNYCRFNTYTTYARDNASLWAWLHALNYDEAPNRPISALTIIHTPGNAQHTDWGYIDPSFVRLVEIFSQWGNSEGPPPGSCDNQNDLDVSLAGDANNDSSLLMRSQVNDHWMKLGDEDYAIGFTGGSDDHTGRPGGWGNGNGGLVGVVTTSATRNSFFDAMVARHTLASTYYASTGPLPVLFAVETGRTKLFSGDRGPIAADGAVVVRVLAADEVQQIQIVVDGCTVLTLDGHAQEVTLPHMEAQRRHYIYVRARRQTTEADAYDEANPAATAWNQTWASPVYLDRVEAPPPPRKN